jgi:hypothetical protein
MQVISTFEGLDARVQMVVTTVDRNLIKHVRQTAWRPFLKPAVTTNLAPFAGDRFHENQPSRDFVCSMFRALIRCIKLI